MANQQAAYNVPSGASGRAAALRCLVPELDRTVTDEHELTANLAAAAAFLYSTDPFRMYEFKVRLCPRGLPQHDWTTCPYAHPGEKARRRDTTRFLYASTPCPSFRKDGECMKGDACELSHGVFECWLHPERYRTKPCRDGTDCRRRVCFFAHTPDQLRVFSPSMGGAGGLVADSPTSTLQAWAHMSRVFESPPVSPGGGASVRRGLMSTAESGADEVAASLVKLQLERTNTATASVGGRARPSVEEEAMPDVGWVTELLK